MIKLNYNDLSQDAQNQLLDKSKKDMLGQFGEELKRYAHENGIVFENLLEEEAIRNLYSYKFSFRI
jgi:hypothetical protein